MLTFLFTTPLKSDFSCVDGNRLFLICSAEWPFTCRTPARSDSQTSFRVFRPKWSQFVSSNRAEWLRRHLHWPPPSIRRSRNASQYFQYVFAYFISVSFARVCPFSQVKAFLIYFCFDVFFKIPVIVSWTTTTKSGNWPCQSSGNAFISLFVMFDKFQLPSDQSRLKELENWLRFHFL